MEKVPPATKKTLLMDEFNSLPLYSSHFPLTFEHTKVEWHSLTGHCGDCDTDIPAEFTRGIVSPNVAEPAPHAYRSSHVEPVVTSYTTTFYGICQQCKRFTRFEYELHDDFSLSKFTHQPNGDILWQRWDSDLSRWAKIKRWCKRLFRRGKKRS